MLTVKLDAHWRIEEISCAKMQYTRPRTAGCNARKGVHGIGGEIPVVRIKVGGIYGFGWSAISYEQARTIAGISIAAVFGDDGMLRPEFRCIEFPILDWLGQIANLPVYKIVANDPDSAESDYKAPAYDTSIYFDELDIEDDKEAVETICKEVDFGLETGHRNFKVKIGRCGRWMDLERGMKRDVDIVLAVRKRISPDGVLMVDANNGYNCNLAKKFLDLTREAKLFWIEEAFHEDDELYLDLKEWMKKENIHTLIADGEGYACPAIINWACKGIIDVIQYDLRGYGFFNWLELGKKLDTNLVKSAPHNYGGFYGNYAQCHISSAIKGFTFAEWDHASVDGIDTSGYIIDKGYIKVPELPGFGLTLDDGKYARLVNEGGWKVKFA